MMREYIVNSGDGESSFSVIDRILKAERSRTMWIVFCALAVFAASYMAGCHVQASADAPHMVTDALLQQLATTRGCTFVRHDGHLSFVCSNSGVAQ